MNSRRQFAVDPASKHALAVRGLRAAVCCRPAHLSQACSSELRVPREGRQGLTDAEIGHDLLTAAENAPELESPLHGFNVLAHAAGRQRAAAEDLAGFVRHQRRGPRA